MIFTHPDGHLSMMVRYGQKFLFVKKQWREIAGMVSFVSDA